MKFVGPFSSHIYRNRRNKFIKLLSQQTTEFTCLIWSGSEVIRNYDAHFSFRANSDFLYLTGFSEPETMLILQKKGDKARTIMGLRPRDLSPNRGSEIWEGERIGVERAPRILGIDEAFDIGDTERVVAKLLSETSSLYWTLGWFHEWDERLIKMIASIQAQNRWIPRIEAILDPNPVLHEMRKVKTPEEIKVMLQSANIASEGHIRAMKTTRPGQFEYQVQAEVEREFKRLGARSPAYNSIVAGGSRACTLHYHANDQKLRAGALLLIDAGAEYEGYASDITRTFPVSGRFTKAQAEIYNLVLQSQLDAIRAAKVGANFLAPHHAAVRTLSQGLKNLGFFKGKSLNEIIKKSLWRAYMPHGTSHWLGLDVHDRGRYKSERNPKVDVKLQAGHVLTIEPGLYFQKSDKTVPSKYRGIGIRIEDDILVTRSGPRVLSARCPKTIQEIERACGPRL